MSATVYRIAFRASTNEDLQGSYRLMSGDTPRDLTGCSLTLGVAKCGSGNVLGTPSVITCTITNATDGRFTFKIPRTTLASMGVGKAAHDLILTDGSSNKERIWFGDIEIERGVQ